MTRLPGIAPNAMVTITSRRDRTRRRFWVIEWSDEAHYPAWTTIWTCYDVREIAPMLMRTNG